MLSVLKQLLRLKGLVPAARVQQQRSLGLAQVRGSNAGAERRVVHCARGAGEVLAVVAGASVAATGNSTVSVDVLKNGTTILSGAIVLDSANAAYAEEAGTVTVAGYAAGDVIEVNVTVSAGTGTLPQGVYVSVQTREAPDA